MRRRRALLAAAAVLSLVGASLAIANAAPGDVTLVCPHIAAPVDGQQITCTYHIEAAPPTTTTTVAPPVTTTTTVAPTTTTAPPQVAGYPNDANTGVPAGTVFSQTVNGDYTVTEANKVIDGWHVTGVLNVNAANVTIRNTQVDKWVSNEGGSTSSFNIHDSTVGPTSGCIVGVAIGQHHFTATRVKTRGVDDGFRIGPPGDVLIQDSLSVLCGPNGSHSDGVQACCFGAGYRNAVIRHNTFDQRPAQNYSFPINLVDSNLYQVTVTDNLVFRGNLNGSYGVVLENKAAVTAQNPKWVVKGNKVVDDTAHDPERKFAFSMEGTCSRIDWGVSASGEKNALVTVDASYRIASQVKGFDACVD